MITLLFTLFCMVSVWIVLDTIYSLIICRYFHTKLKYRLFALRDRLRNLRIENPSLGNNVFRMMELRINGCIGLVHEISFLRLVIATCSDSFLSEKDKESALEMKKTVRWIMDNRETEIGKQLFDIEKQSMRTVRASFIHNSPLIALLFYVIILIARFRPRILAKCKEIRDNYIRETVPAMMVNAAR